jgi:ATP-dependent Clp protease protease subunit
MAANGTKQSVETRDMGLRITNAGDNAVVYLYGVIGDEYGGITADQMRKELSEIPSKQPIDVHIHSDGGSFFDGLAMHSQLSQRKGPVNVIVDGLAASAASLVAMAGTTITMAQHSWMMIHEANGVMRGRASDFRAAADRLEATNAEIVSIYSKRFTGSADEMRNLLDAETWLDCEACVACGLADCVGDGMSIAACVDRSFNYRKTPEVLLKAGPSPAMLEREALLETL